MANLDMLLGNAGAETGVPFLVLATSDAALTIPDGVRFGFISCRSPATPYAVTLPLIAACLGPCALVFSIPDGAAFNVTLTAAGGDTVFGGGTLVVAGDNLVVLIGISGTTNWEGHVGT